MKNLFFIFLIIPLLAVGCKSTQKATKQPPSAGQSIKNSRNNGTTVSPSSLQIQQWEQKTNDIYTYNKKTLQLTPSDGSSFADRDLYLTTADNKQKLLTLPGDEPSGGSVAQFGTTSIPSLVYVYIGGGDGGGFWNTDVFVNLNSESWLRAGTSNADGGGNSNLLTLSASSASTTVIKFIYQGSCIKDNIIQDGKQLVRILGIKSTMMGKVNKESNFANPIQLTCQDPGGLGSLYKEDFNMSYYAIDPGLTRVGIMVKGKDTMGKNWKEVWGYDLGKQDFIPWSLENEGFKYQKSEN